ncbi:MAG: glycoside hydrolase family 2, partial [Acholeplasmataceae bacterium]|nr:glycoside hydrolase family 2 [Acholeplasmataceae bacterium]
SWGIHQVKSNQEQQQMTLALYHLTKALDKSRFVISNDGWEHTKSDLITIHDYVSNGEELKETYQHLEKMLRNEYVNKNQNRQIFAEGFYDEQQPIIISEYGGIALSSDLGWGYGEKVKDIDAMIKRLDGLTQSIKELDMVSGYCLTQTTDVEQEMNGLLKPDREPKINYNIIAKINEK